MEKMISVNPDGFFNLELSTGRIAYASGEGQAIIIPLEAIQEFTRAMPEEEPHKIFHVLGLCIGRHFGRTMDRLYQGAGMGDAVYPEDFLNNLNGILTLHGFGIVDMEIWGDVVIFEWETLFKSKLLTSDFQEGIISGILREFSKQDFEAATVENGMRKKCKLLAGSPRMIDHVRQWVEEGAGTGEIVVRLRNGQHLR
jgi:hypothetical protein